MDVVSSHGIKPRSVNEYSEKRFHYEEPEGAIEGHFGYHRADRAVFEQEELMPTWSLCPIQLIGEAVAQLGKAFHVSHPEIPWAQIVAMRNVLVNGYFGGICRKCGGPWKETFLF